MGWGHLCMCARAPPPPISVSEDPIDQFCYNLMCGYRPNSYEIYKIRRWGDCTFARASPVSLPRKPLSLDIETTPKTDLSLSDSLVHRQTWRLPGVIQFQFLYSLSVTQYFIYKVSFADFKCGDAKVITMLLTAISLISFTWCSVSTVKCKMC